MLTHDPKFDIPVLTAALRMPLAYVGAMGSRRTHEAPAPPTPAPHPARRNTRSPVREPSPDASQPRRPPGLRPLKPGRARARRRRVRCRAVRYGRSPCTGRPASDRMTS
ncbi:hypothetical protein AB0H12_42850 [Actinosynnema sp. NPDC023794]